MTDLSSLNPWRPLPGALRGPTWTLALALALLALPSGPVAAQGCDSLGVSPVTVQVPDAQPAQSYQRTLSVQNPCTYGRTVTVQFEGAAGGWATSNPGSGFALPPQSTQNVRLTLAVPAGTGPGERQGLVRFVAEATDAPGGSGASVRVAVAVPLNVTVGGDPIVALAWMGARTNDTDTQTPPVGVAELRNEGNVRSAGTMAATVSAFGDNATIFSAMGTGSADPGASAEVQVAFHDTLPVGQYTMHFSSQEPPGFRAAVDFNVAPPGLHPPHGTLLALLHAAYAATGDVARIDGRFSNDGSVRIQSAVLKAEVRQGDRLLAALQSDALAVPPGTQVNLTVYWTPPAAGSYTVVGHVVYDGYLSHTTESILNVAGSPVLAGGFPWWLWLALAAAIGVIVGGYAWWHRRRKPQPAPAKQAAKLATLLAPKQAPRPIAPAIAPSPPPVAMPAPKPQPPVSPPAPLPQPEAPKAKPAKKQAAKPAKKPAKKAKPAKTTAGKAKPAAKRPSR
ncbi:MAG: hypothetical protein QOI63_1397 [Thermoplasmata archaeon]|nr:hypothetical protein [Thermoplasmata archaeon]